MKRRALNTFHTTQDQVMSQSKRFMVRRTNQWQQTSAAFQWQPLTT